MMIIQWNKKWNSNNYVKGNKTCAGANKNATFIDLVDIVYTVTEIDGTQYNIIIYYVIEPLENVLARKFHIKDDYDVAFIMFDEDRYKVIYVNTIYKHTRVHRSTAPITPNLIPTVPQVAPNLNLNPSQQQNQFPSYSGDNQLSVVVVPFTTACNPLRNDDFDIYGTIDLSNDALYIDNGDDETDNNGDGDDEASPEYPKVRFSASQFEDNPL